MIYNHDLYTLISVYYPSLSALYARCGLRGKDLGRGHQRSANGMPLVDLVVAPYLKAALNEEIKAKFYAEQINTRDSCLI